MPIRAGTRFERDVPDRRVEDGVVFGEQREVGAAREELPVGIDAALRKNRVDGRLDRSGFGGSNRSGAPQGKKAGSDEGEGAGKRHDIT